MEISDLHIGQILVVLASSGFFSKAASLAEAVLIALTITNTTNAMIRKLMIAVRNLP